MAAPSPQLDWKIRKSAGAPLYQQIQELVLERIRSGTLKPGDALPSYPQLSKWLGVADKTVRQAYDTLSQAGVLSIERGRGTFVARAGENAKTPRIRGGLIGVMPPGLPVKTSEESFFWKTMRAIQESAHAQSLDTMTMASVAEVQAMPPLERAGYLRRLDGLIVWASPSEELFKSAAALGIPLVLADSTAPGVDSVNFDNFGGARTLTQRLIESGHRRVGFVRIDRGQPAADREAGYRFAMGDAELPIKPSWVVSADMDADEPVEPAIDALLDEGVSAVLCFNATLAQLTAARAKLRKLSIPADLSLAMIGEENRTLPDGTVLEAIAFGASELGRRSVKRLAELLKVPQPPQQDVIPAQHLPGNSIAALKASRAKSKSLARTR